MLSLHCRCVGGPGGPRVARALAEAGPVLEAGVGGWVAARLAHPGAGVEGLELGPGCGGFLLALPALCVPEVPARMQ